MIRWVLLAALALPAFSQDWNPRRAADYLDARQKEWFAFKPAISAHGGPCVSCHTGLTYLMARPALRRALSESQPTSYEIGLLDGLRARLSKTEAKDMFPGFAKEPLASQSIGVDAIFAALLLTLDDKAAGRFSPEARQAFDRLWKLQIRDGDGKGAWPWFSLDLDPWEMPESRFFGAALAAMAVEAAPADYRSRADVRPQVDALTQYLTTHQQSQPLHNRLVLLWSTGKLFPKSSRPPILDEIWKKQQPDGGWTMEALGPWTPHTAAPASTAGSNAYATAVVAYTLGRSGATPSNPKFKRALQWLQSHQDPDTGSWGAESMNKTYAPGAMPVRFLRDAATGFASLAILESVRY